ncbi:OPT oligopeptide transporter protein-domain-containing protein [Phyllosticta citribraziliensis]|uniref:OPT oligopeptide transporter protein-domain-containing protein n=1 Tax=Phyllosticta citribraziliensis TaxID=989973 RepID=A0ABR1LKW8_9PEZI
MATDGEINAAPDGSPQQEKETTTSPDTDASPGPKLRDEEHAYNEKGAIEVQHAAASDTDLSYDVRKEDRFGEVVVLSDAKDLVTHVLHVDDDPSLSPWTFRAISIGTGLSIFSSVLQTIFYFKPQVIYISVVFLTVIAYIIGEGMALIPRIGPVGRFLNPFPFNSKEHAFIVVMASAGATSAVATEILAAQRLYYNEKPSVGAAVFLVISAQLLGYGIAGLMREVLVQPTRMLWPINIPVNSLFETLHRDRTETWKRLRVFLIVFFVMFFYEIIPEWMFPLLQGVSVFCLANQDSLVFTNLFGGSQGNEGLGFLSVSFDWQYIASLGSPLWMPLYTLTNSCVGYLLCICLYMGLYYMNVWRAKDVPFMSQLLFDPSSNFTSYVEYNLTKILHSDNTINDTAVVEAGIPYLTATYISYLITTNMGITAALVHMALWNYDDIKYGWSFLRPSALKKVLNPSWWRFWEGGETQEEHKQRILADPSMDPHYKLMMQNGYKEVPQWWYGIVLVVTFVIGMATLYGIKSTLPWWGYIVANVFAAIFILFFGAQMGLTGFQFNQQPVLQMLAGYLHPGRPLANMYFTTFGYNGVSQGQWLLRDLKLAQLAHLSPRSTFTAQMLGSIIGAVFDYIMMETIVDNQSDILKSVEGSNIWSGQNVQQYNTLALAWSMAKHMFSVGARYQWVTISYLIGFVVPFPLWLLYRKTKIRFFQSVNLSIILWYMGWLFVGVNSSILSYFALGFFAQFLCADMYKPQWFVRWNYLVSAALDGGTQVIVFILSFAVFGGSGKAHDFPLWAGNNGGIAQNKNIDFCMYNPANGG